MEKQTEDLSQDKVNAGRGIAKQLKSSDRSSSKGKHGKGRPDERARKAGF
ncbi:MAG: hypothetical protein O6852_04195 [Gammaproteobacteria bacterium]|jgi:hypothetical protein|nr:hypothetical protein [Gammaproteobacteria bacterium]